jgi:hypothetical protein
MYAKGLIHGSVGEHDALRGYMIAVAVMMGLLHIVALDMDKGKPKTSKIAVAVLSVVVGIVWILAVREMA